MKRRGKMGSKTVVMSLGGSIIVPEEIDVPFLKIFKEIIQSLKDERFIVICGGGKICRNYQNAARETAEVSKEDLDWIGISATRLNAELVRSIFGDEAHNKVIHDPDEEIDGSKRIVIGAGFEPGSSTDLRAVQLANRFGAVRVINMSNIDYVYSGDPKKDPNAERLEEVSWSQFRKLVGDEWDPGLSMPFDPIASREAEALGLEVIIIGNDVDNLEKLLRGEAFKGTTISS
jgi:uridylate kinase